MPSSRSLNRCDSKFVMSLKIDVTAYVKSLFDLQQSILVTDTDLVTVGLKTG